MIQKLVKGAVYAGGGTCCCFIFAAWAYAYKMIDVGGYI